MFGVDNTISVSGNSRENTKNNFDAISGPRNTTKSKDAESKEQLKGFLQVLTEQMRHQDPTSPMEVGDFSQLMSSFVMTQESARTNELLGQILELHKASSTETASAGSLVDNIGYVSHHVKCICNTAIANKDGANFTFDLPKSAGNVEVVIKDKASGKELFKENIGPVEIGRNKYLWRGGDKIEVGKEYEIEVIARENDGSSISASYEVEDVVSSVNKSESGAVYAILSDGIAVNTNQIISVSS